MAALLDTTVGVLLLRRKPREDAAELIRIADAAIEGGSALLPAVAVSELVVGEESERGSRKLANALARIPAVVLPVEAASHAGSMGAFLSSEGATVPLPDLLIAATAVWLEIPLLTWDADYSRSRQLAARSSATHPGADLWRALRLHPASRIA